MLFDIVRSHNAGDPHALPRGRQEYIGHTARGGVQTATLDWDEELRGDLAELRRPQPDSAILARLGERLRIFLSELGFDEEKARIAGDAMAGVRTTITMQLAAAELFILPWELYTLRVKGQAVGELPHVLFRYCWKDSQTTPESPSPRPEGGRILFAWSAARGSVPAREHQLAIAQAAALGHYPFVVERDVLPNVSQERLRAALAPRKDEQPVAVLHILCHGLRIGSTYSLAWDSDDPAASFEGIDARWLRQLLEPHAGHLRMVVLCACDSSNSGELGNRLGSLAEALHRAGIASVIASRFPLSVDGSSVMAATLYRTLLEQPASLETAFVAARQRLLEETRNLDWASLQLFARHQDADDTRPLVIRPYRGLAAYQPAQQRFFWGRQREIQEAISDLEALHQTGKPRFLVVAGASGSGKSSVVLGGMLPALTGALTAEALPEKYRTQVQSLLLELSQDAPSLRVKDALEVLRRALNAAPQSQSDWEYAVMRPGNDPLAALTGALSQRRDQSRRFLLVVDQLEEIFTHTADATVRQHFLQRLWTLAQANNLFSCVVTLRVDFLGHCAEITLDELGLRLDRVAYDEAHRVFIAQMSTELMRMAIEGPARLVGLQLDEGLTAKMIADVQGEPGALPLLSHVLDLLWQRRVGCRLSLQDYTSLGEAAGALSSNAERVYERLSQPRKEVAHRLLVRLVSHSELALGDTRRRAPEAELRVQVGCAAADFDATVAEFVDARLLVRGEEAGQVLELAHEALLRKWQRLRDWLEEDRQMIGEVRELRQWTEQFATFNRPLVGAQLAFAVRVLQRHPRDVEPKITAMVQASVAAEQQRQDLEQQRRWRNRMLSTSFIFFLIVVAGFSVYNQLQLQQQSDLAASRLLTLRAFDHDKLSMSESLLLAAQAQKLHDDRESRSGLAAALTFSQGLRTYLRKPQDKSSGASAGTFSAIAFSPSSDQLAASDTDGRIFVYELKNGGPPKQLATSGGLYALAYSPDGRYLAAAGSGTGVAIWDLTHDAPPFRLETGARLIRKLAFSPAGKWLAAADDGGRITAWRVGPSPWLSHTMTYSGYKALTALRFFPGDENKIAVGTEGSVQLFNLAEGTNLPELLSSLQSSIQALAISPDGQWIIGGSHYEGAESFALGGGLPRAQFLKDLKPVDLFFRAGGHVVGACTTAGTLLLTDVSTGQAIGEPLPLHVGDVSSCIQSADEALLALNTQDGVALWDLTAHPALHPRVLSPPDGPRAAGADDDARRTISAMAVSPDEETLALGAADGSISFLHINQDGTFGRPERVSGVHVGRVNALAYRVDGSEVLSVGDDGTVGRTGTDPPVRRRPLAAAEPALGKLVSMAHYREKGNLGELLAVGAENRQLRLWELRSEPPRERGRIAAAGSAGSSLYELRFSPDGETLAATTAATVSLWRTSDLHPIDTTSIAHDANKDIRSLDFSPDGRLLATGGDDETVRLWNVKAQPPIKEGNAIPTKSRVRRVRFSPDGQLLTAAVVKKEILLWSVESKKEFGSPLVGHPDIIRTLVYGPKRLLFSGDDETIWSWQVDMSDGRKRVCDRVNRNLAKEEWQNNLPGRPYCRLCPQIPAGPDVAATAPECPP